MKFKSYINKGKIMEKCTFPKEIETLCLRTFERLINMNYNPASSKFIFPKYYSKTKKDGIRISEQEARFAFFSELEKLNCLDDKCNYSYSVETPTKNQYKDFSTDKPKVCLTYEPGKKSGSIDLSLYKNINIIDINLEFKAYNVDIDSDFIKLFAENSNGLFFHILDSVGNKTLTVNEVDTNKKKETGVLIKYKSSITENSLKRQLEALWKNDYNINSKKILYFFICSLKPVFAIYKCATKNEILTNTNFFDFEYIIENGDIRVTEYNHWIKI